MIIKGRDCKLVVTGDDGKVKEFAVGGWELSPEWATAKVEIFTLRERLRGARYHAMEIGRYLQRIRSELRGMWYALVGRHVYRTFRVTGTWEEGRKR